MTQTVATLANKKQLAGNRFSWLVFFARRIFRAACTFFLVTLGAFFALRVAPGNALTLIAAGREIDPAIKAAWILRYGLNKPVLVQFLYYVRNLLQGDLGFSYYYDGRPVTDLLAPAIRITLQWQVPALLLATAAALLLGVGISASSSRRLQAIFTWFLLVGFSLPEFVVAALLILILSLRLHLLPVAGISSPIYLVLPVVTMAIPVCAGMCQVLRSDLQEIMQQDYVRTARAGGLGPFRVLMFHALPNAIQPFLNIVAFQAGRCIGGAFLIETIYNIPGVGRLAILAIQQRDYPVILGVTVLMTLAFVISSLLVDLLAGIFDPRLASAKLEA